MIICGIQKLSLLNYPKKISCIIFTAGCPFRCPYCHNKSLVIPKFFPKAIKEEEIFSFLKKRKNKLDGIVISGGEPTIHKGLKDFIKKVKDLNFLVKLDTNGTNPKVLKNLLKNNLLDYIAMDVKAPFEKYPLVVNASLDIKKIKESISIILSSKIPYEFRTTVLKKMLSYQDLLSIAKAIKGADLFYMQKFVNKETLDKNYKNKISFSDKMLISLKKEIEFFVKKCEIR